MYGAILAIHILVSLGLVITVLLQSGKGGGLAGAFGGGGGAGAVFGGQTAAGFLTKATRYLAVVFMLTSLTLAFVVRSRNTSAVLEGLQGQQAAPASAAGEVLPGEGLPEGIPQPATPDGGTETAAPGEAATENPVATDDTGE
jgi:protein translocase SecG subunit